MEQTLHDAFGVESPIADTKKIPLTAVAPLGDVEDEPDPAFQFEYRPLRRTLKNIAQRKPIWCWGPSGCGKTEYFIQVAKRLKRPCRVISFGEETSLRELLGTFSLVGNETGTGFETRFRYGQLAKALRTPLAIIVLDEFNMAPATVSAQFNRLLETGEITVPETGEIVRAADGVTFAATANTPGTMDESGIYAGSQTQNGATRSRFAGLRMHYLPAEKEEKIVTQAYPRLNAVIEMPDTVKSSSALMVECGNFCRSLVDDGTVSLPFTVRHLKEWAKGSLLLKDIRDAFADAYYDLLAPSEASSVGEVFHKVFGVRLEA